jgi:hypothetical protein
VAIPKKADWRPKAVKRQGLLVEETGSEVVVYNLEGYRVHCLNDQAVRIWGLCNGRRTIGQIAAGIDLAIAPKSKELVVGNVIAQLEKLGLVEESPLAPALVSRRDMARRIGIGVAAMVALPLITSVTAPTAQAANTCVPTNGTCGGSGQTCCPGLVCCGRNKNGNINKCVTSANC